NLAVNQAYEYMQLCQSNPLLSHLFASGLRPTSLLTTMLLAHARYTVYTSTHQRRRDADNSSEHLHVRFNEVKGVGDVARTVMMGLVLLRERAAGPAPSAGMITTLKAPGTPPPPVCVPIGQVARSLLCVTALPGEGGTARAWARAEREIEWRRLMDSRGRSEEHT